MRNGFQIPSVIILHTLQSNNEILDDIFFSANGAGRIAQLVEQLTLNQRVQGSNPCAPTNKINTLGK